MNTNRLDQFFPVKRENVMPATNGKRRYEGGAHGHRTGSFPIDRMSPNRDIGADAVLLRERSRYLYKNTSNSKRSVNAMSNGIVGTGIIPTFRSKNKVAQAQIKGLWDEFAKWADFYARLDFYGIEKLVTKTFERDGECLILRRRVPVSECVIGIQLQVLEMEYLADYINYQQLPDGGWTYNGIEYDKRGKTRAYWLFSRHPSEWWTQPLRVSVDDVIHVLDVNFPAQNRGVPESATTIIESRDLDEFEDAELMGKKVQAAHAVFRITNDPEAMDNASKNKEDYDCDDDLERVEPGMIYHLFPGEDVRFNTPPTSQGAEDYRKAKHRSIAAGYGVTYEMMTGDYGNVNFSSGRMGWIEHQRTIEHLQWMTLIPQLCNRVMKWFLEQLPLAPGGMEQLPSDLMITWTTPRREMIDPVKESEATKNLIRMGKLPWSKSVQEDGEDPEEVLEQYKRDLKMWQDAKMTAEWSPDLLPKVTTPAELKDEK